MAEVNLTLGDPIEVKVAPAEGATNVTVSPAPLNVVQVQAAIATDGLAGPAGPGIPEGGTENQFVQKADGGEYDSKWSAYTLPGSDGAKGQGLVTNGLGSVVFGSPLSSKVEIPVRFDEAVSKGDPLYVTGYNNGQERITVAKADASDSSMMPSIGLANGTYSANANGSVVCIGSLEDVNTQNAPNDFQEGDVLYVAAGGGLTNAKPTGTNLIQNVGKASIRQQVNGEIVVMAIGRSNDVPNIPNGQAWIGNSSGVATPTALGSLVIDSLRVKSGAQSVTVTDGDATIDFVEGTGITVSLSDAGSGEVDVTVAGSDASNTEKGIAKFKAADFSVTDGAVSLVDGIGTVFYDKNPQLGGDLDVNGNEIVSTNSGDVIIRPSGTGNVILGNFQFDVDQTMNSSLDNYVLTYDDTSKLISLEQASGSGETYTISAADGDNADEEKIVLTDSQSGTDEVVLEAGTGLSVSRTGDKITFTNTVTDTNTSLGDTDQTLDDDRDIDVDGNELSIVNGASGIANFASNGLVSVNGAFLPGQYNTSGTTTGLTSAGDFADGCEVLTKFGTATTNMTAGDVYYYAGAWTQSASGTVANASKLLAVASGTSSSSPLVTRGLVRVADNTGFSSAASGDVLYLNATAGHVGTTAPTSGVVRVVGYVVNSSNSLIYFDPSKDWIEL